MLLKNTLRTALWFFNILLNFAFFVGGRPDDVILGGFFSEHFPRMSQSGNTRDNYPCQEHNRRATADKLAMEFAVSEINRSEDILFGIQLGTNMKDTCSDLDYAVNNTLDYDFIKARFVNQCEPGEIETKCCLNRTGNATLVAIVAGAYSHIVKAIVNLVGLFKVPVIGYSSTSPSLNKIDYFLRTVAPDTDATQVMVDLILKLRWNIVVVLYVDNEFGHYAADCFRTAIRRLKTKICIAYDGRFSKASGREDIKKVVEGIKKVKSRVITFFGTIEDFVYFQENSDAFDANSYVWISSELWLRSDLIGISPSIKHMLTIIPEQGYSKDRFDEYLGGRADVNKTCSHVHRNNMKYERECEDNHRSEPNCSFECSKYIPHVLDAVYAVAMGMHNMLGCQSGKSCRNNLHRLKSMQNRSLLDFIKKLNFSNNLTNQTISFDSNGNPRVTRFTVVKLEIGNGAYSNTTIGNWICREENETPSCKGRLSNSIFEVVNPTSFNSSCGPTCTPGWYKSVKEDHPDCCWTCKRCTGNKFTNTSGQFSCDQCDDSKWPDSNHTSCAEIEHEYLDIRSAPGVLILAWNCLGVAVVLFVGGVFLKYSASHIVKASSRQLSLLLLVGISADFAILIALLREPNVSQCTAIFVFGHAANCLVAGTLFLKTNRIHRIFRKSAMTERPRCLGNACQLSIITLLVLIELTLSTIILVFQPENGEVKVTYIMQGDSKKAFLLCNFFGKTFQNDLFHVLLWSYECGMIFVCTYQAYLVRKVPENYNEARYITFTMVTISMNIIVYVITTSGMEGKNLMLVFCIFQSLKASVALGCMFLPKVYVILFQPEKNVPHNPVQSKLGTFVEENSAVRIKPHDSISSGSSIQGSVSSEASTAGSGTAPTSTRRRPYRKVGAKMEEEGPEDKFESAGDDLPAREQGVLPACKQDVSTDTTEGLKGSANIVLVNSLATSNNTA